MVLAVVVAVVAVFAITNVVTIVGSKGSIVTAEKAGIGNADAIHWCDHYARGNIKWRSDRY